MPKNFELLRPFDLLNAKPGDPIIDGKDGERGTLVAGPNQKEEMVVNLESFGYAVRECRDRMVESLSQLGVKP